MADRDLDELADAIRVGVFRRRMQRIALPSTPTPLQWAMLPESEKINWRDIAEAVREVGSG